MATINLDLYVLWKSDRFVTSLTNPSQPTLPTPTQGDTWNCNVYFVDGSPMQIVNLADVDVSARFRATGGRINYGDSAPNQTRIGPANNVIAITRARAGVKPDTSEIHRIVLPAAPTGGAYTLNFPGPTVFNAPSGVAAPKGSIVVQSNWTITQIRDAIRALPFYEVFNATLFDAPGYGQYVTLTGTPTDYSIDYGNGSNRKGPIEPCTASDNTLQFLYGWNVSVPLTASDFSDLFISANGPSFFEVMLNGGQAAFIQLTAAPSGGGDIPAFINGPPPNGSVGSPYSFAYTATGFPSPTFAVSAGGLPAGLALSGSGGITGTPITSGTYTGVVTITNSNGSANQAFLITIVAGGGGGVFYVGGIIFDGSYDAPVPIGPPEISHGIPDDASSSLIWRQKYHQRETAWSALPMGGLSCPYSSGAVAVDETPLSWTGIADIMEFFRTWALIPTSRRRPGSYSKTYKSQQYLVVNGQIDPSTYSITSRTAMIAADFFYDYFNIITQGIPIPAMMDIAVVHNGPFHYYELYGGFPSGTATQAGNNYAYCLIGVDTRQYMGPIWERFLVYGQ